MALPVDIRKRLEADFGPGGANGWATELERAAREIDGVDLRVLRCAIFLAAGDVEKLRHNLEVAEQDWRDLIYWAEYDANGQVRDFHQPFGQEELKG